MDIKYKISDGIPEAEAKAYVEKKIEMLRKFVADPQASHWNVRLTNEDKSNTAHVLTGETIFAAIDELKDELKKKMSRHKDKRSSMMRRGGRLAKKLMRK